MTKRFYAGAAVLAILCLVLAFLIAKAYDDAKFASLDRQVREYAADSDETRLLFTYGQVFESDRQAFCDSVKKNTERHMDRGYALVNKLRDFEKANLLADYAQARRQYYLNNVELWLQLTVARRDCGETNSTLALFFTDTERLCPDCLVQGEVLDQLRASCPSLRVITLASDLDIAPIEAAKRQFNITSTPAIAIDNERAISGVYTREQLAKELNCKIS